MMPYYWIDSMIVRTARKGGRMGWANGTEAAP